MPNTDRNKQLWDIWYQMMQRCYSTSHPKYHNYGARGITVCERWTHYAHFREDMGFRPPHRSLDRIDNDGNYEPSNCTWTSNRSNTNNRRSTCLVTYEGVTLPLSDWARMVFINYHTLHSRIRRNGWSIERALFT